MHQLNVLAADAPARQIGGAKQVSARVFALADGQHSHPYHFHHGVEQWLAVLGGSPRLRTPDGERTLREGDVVAFPAGPAGAHQVQGQGRILILSEVADLDVVEYPESGTAELRPAGRTFRSERASPAPAGETRVVNWLDEPVESVGQTPPGYAVRACRLREKLGGVRLGAGLYELDPGEASWPYHYEGVEEEWLLVLRGTPTLRAPDGEHALEPGDLVVFPPGPDGAHKMLNRSDATARYAMLSPQPADDVSICIYPDSGKLSVWPWPGRRMWLQDEQPAYYEGEV
jgi:uncharacterized cupin superfamily protein